MSIVNYPKAKSQKTLKPHLSWLENSHFLPKMLTSNFIKSERCRLLMKYIRRK